MSIANTIRGVFPDRVSDLSQETQRRLSYYTQQYPNRVAALRLLPALFWIAFFLGFSLLIVGAYSFFLEEPGRNLFAFLQAEYTVANYVEFFQTPLYLDVMWDSFVIGVQVTVISVLIAYPVAYFLAFVAGERKYFFMILVILPFWINLVVRTYAWRLILSPRGLINYVFYDTLGLWATRHNYLFSQEAIVIGLVHVFLPYMLIPIYTSLDRIDESHIEAAKNLGANRIEAFYEVTLPQSLPGASAGIVMVFVLAFGSFVTPLLLGGSQNIMIANLIGQMFREFNNWPLGSAMSFIFLAASLGLVYVFNRIVGLDELYGEGGEA